MLQTGAGPMRIVYPKVTPMGLGNNLITVAKAYLIAQSCNMKYLPPVWPRTDHMPTANGYGYYFPSSLSNKLLQNIFTYILIIRDKFNIRLWPPVLYFDRVKYEDSKINDIGEACLNYLKASGLDNPGRSVIITTSGTWGQYASIKHARTWLLGLLASHCDSARRLKSILGETEGKLRIAVNIRMRDFKQADARFQEGERCVRIPLDWYIRVCRLIRENCDCAFILVTDGQREELAPFLEEFGPVNYLGEPYSELLGLLLIANADCVVCSNSTYSRMGCFLNDKPYIWLADVLVKDASGKFGYLWKDRSSPVPASDRSDLNAVRRCFALQYEFSALPEGLKRYAQAQGKLPIEIADDLLYGDPVYLMR